MAKLQPDYIRFTLTLNADDAQKAIHELDKESKKLKEESKELRKKMAELTATGKRESEEFKNLETQLAKNNKALGENNAKTQQLLSVIDKQNKSYSQLTKEAKNLQRQLDNTVKALQPEEYDRLKKELDETRIAMKRLKEGSEENVGVFEKLFGRNGKLKTIGLGALSQIGYTITQSFEGALRSVQQFASEAIDLAAKADGVTHAFRDLDRPDLLSSLRSATKGTVTDLQLMQSVVKARDFRIPLDDLGKYLAFAQLKAQQTGQSVEYMTESIITGLGRKSLLILDNLGLSAAQINEETAKTGDFMQGVAAIVDKQLTQAGQYTSAADKVTAADVKMENAKLKLGQRLSWVGNLWTNLKSTMADVVDTTLTTANERFQQQREEVIRLHTDINPLLNRYDELATKASLNTTEQNELKNIINQVSSAIPGVIGQFDQYGNALSLNTEKARAFIDQQTVLLQYTNREAIKETEANLSEYQKIYDEALAIQQSGGRYIYSQTSSFGTSQLIWDDSQETLHRAEETIREYGALIQGATASLQKLRGEDLDDMLKNHTARQKMRDTFLKMNRKQLEAWLADENNANSEYRDLANTYLSAKSGPNPEAEAGAKKEAEKNAALKARAKAAADKLMARLAAKAQRDAAKAKKDADAADRKRVKDEAAAAKNQFDAEVRDSSTLLGQLMTDASERSVTEIQKIIDKVQILLAYLSSPKNANGTTTIDGTEYSRQDILSLGITDSTLKLLESSPKEVDSLTSALKKMKGELGGRSPFMLFSQEIKTAVKNLKEGELEAGVEGIGNAVEKFAPALAQFGEDLGTLFGSDELGQKIARVSNAVGGLGQTAAGVGQIMSGDVAGGAMAAVGGISQMVSALDGLFGADYSAYNRMVEEYNALEQVWDTLISKKQEYIDISYGDEARQTADEVERLLSLQQQSLRTLGVERLNAGASAGSHSIGVRQRKGMNDAAWAELRKASASIGVNYDRVAGGRMTGLFDLSVQQLAALQEQAPTFWAKLDDDVREYLQKIIECGDEVENMKAKMQETLTGVSFDSFYDTFLSMLSDMDKDSQDFADDFGENMKKALLSNLMANKYKQRIRELYDAWAGMSDSNGDGVFDLTSGEAAGLQESVRELAAQIVAERDAMAAAFGWSSGSSTASQTASHNYGTTLSQETGEEISGRMTMMQVVLTDIARNSTAQLECSTEIRDILYECNANLNKIERNTQELSNIHSKLSEIERKL